MTVQPRVLQKCACDEGMKVKTTRQGEGLMRNKEGWLNKEDRVSKDNNNQGKRDGRV
jgi:hypothetical protein